MTNNVQILTIEVMSGVDDGSRITLQSDNDGSYHKGAWIMSIGRKDSNDITLRNDTWVSRNHANLILRDGVWFLEDKNSTNGSFLENKKDFFNDVKVHGEVLLDIKKVFRIGRTWLELIEFEDS